MIVEMSKFQYEVLQSGIWKSVEGNFQCIENGEDRWQIKPDTSQVTNSLLKIKIPISKPAQLIYCNGYQSWSESNWFRPTDCINQLSILASPIWRYFRMDQYGDHEIRETYHSNAPLYSFDYILLKLENKYMLLGSRKQKMILEYEVRSGMVHVITPLHPKVDLFVKEGDQVDLINRFAKSKELLTFRTKTGWTSWYHYYTDITPDILENQVDYFREKEVPIDYFQIDDGWQESIGEWTPNSKFEGSMDSLSKHISTSGFNPGLWLAPFIIDQITKSKVPNNWVRKDDKGKDVIAGRSLYWGGLFYSLEWKNKEVREHIQKSLEKPIQKWRYKLLKLDFLYAATLGLRADEVKDSIEEVNRIISEYCEGAEVLACGAINDLNQDYTYLRVGADVSHYWEDKLLAGFVKYRERVSTIASLRNTINRSSWTSFGIGVDPDVFILKQKKLKLADHQIQALFLINTVLGNLCFTSDDLSEYGHAEKQIYYSQFPSISRSINFHEVLEVDLGYIQISTENSEFLLVYNLTKTMKEIRLPNGAWIFSTDFLEESHRLLGQSVQVLKKYNPSDPILYSSGHIFPGEDILEHTLENGQLEVVKKSLSKTSSEVIIAVDDPNFEIQFKEESIVPFQIGKLHAIRINVKREY